MQGFSMDTKPRECNSFVYFIRDRFINSIDSKNYILLNDYVIRINIDRFVIRFYGFAIIALFK